MEIKILITKQNKERILKLIDELVECEAEATVTASAEKEILTAPRIASSPAFIKEVPEVENIETAEPCISKNEFGSWGMFNSYIPGKVALRVLLHLINENKGKPVRYQDLVDECISAFSRAGLGNYRGFPKKTSDSARGRLAWHLIWPYYEMGLIKVDEDKSDQFVTITREGLEFAKLRSPLLDNSKRQQALSTEERRWLLTHLRKIDKLGYKEFTILNELTEFLSSGNRRFKHIVNWFKSNKEFESWIRQGSRHKDDPKALARQLHNISTTFASGKIALLRELGIVSDSRAKYTVISDLEVS